jgi:small redox-active disulfide protein 2
MLKIQVLGPGCRNCRNLEANVREAVAQVGVEAEIEKVTDFGEIASMGVMRTPGLVINGEVKVSGRVPSVEEIKALIH